MKRYDVVQKSLTPRCFLLSPFGIKLHSSMNTTIFYARRTPGLRLGRRGSGLEERCSQRRAMCCTSQHL